MFTLMEGKPEKPKGIYEFGSPNPYSDEPSPNRTPPASGARLAAVLLPGELGHRGAGGSDDEAPDSFRALKQPGFETPKHLRVQ